ncbi:hypothetical protein [uncultured Ruminococcus sp.]|uniref:hypothetical protein n=1 Tax=uncultured Ruminococcus sp. TaxID=165186 RepID=UPI0025E3D2E6|nr:hypothetical protein [uncultured Ruminococcus sp.]
MRKIVCPLCCAVILLGGCGAGREPDLAEDYKDFWDHTFEGDHSIKKNAAKCSDIENVWDVSYTDKKGISHSDELRLDIETDKEHEKREADWTVLNYVAIQCGKAVSDELFDDLIKKNFECVRDEEDAFKYTGEGFTISISTDHYELIEPTDEMLAQGLDSSSGMCYAKTDLKSWAQQKDHGLTVRIVLENADDVDGFADKLLKFGGDYCEYTVSPQNYCFSLYAPDDSGQLMTAAAGCRIMGEQADLSEYSTSYILAKLGRSGDTVLTDIEEKM